MSFAKPNKKEFNDQDDYQRLLCTEPGCSRPWSVMVDRPKCSKHQWNVAPESFPNVPVMREVGNDGLAWARKLVKLHKSGFRVRALSMKMACEALRIDNPMKIEVKENKNTVFAQKLKAHEYKPKPLSEVIDDVF